MLERWCSEETKVMGQVGGWWREMQCVESSVSSMEVVWSCIEGGVV